MSEQQGAEGSPLPSSKVGEPSENEVPSSESPFTEAETVEPLEGDPFEVVNDKTSHDAVRRSLALPILWFLLVTYGLTIGAFVGLRLIPGSAPIFSSQDFTAAIAGISGLQGLAAAVVGFYFGVKQGEK
jgi:hypothetical protein